TCPFTPDPREPSVITRSTHLHGPTRRPDHHGGAARRDSLGRGRDTAGLRASAPSPPAYTRLTWMADARVPVHVLPKIARHGRWSPPGATCTQTPSPSRTRAQR